MGFTEDLRGVDSPAHQVALDVLRYHHDEGRGPEGEVFDPQQIPLVDIAGGAEAPSEGDLGAVVFGDVGDPEFLAQPGHREAPEDHALVDVGRSLDLEDRPEDRVVVPVRADDVALARQLIRIGEQHLSQSEFVEHGKPVGKERQQVPGATAEFAGDVAGVAVAAAGFELRPVVEAHVDAQAFDCSLLRNGQRGRGMNPTRRLGQSLARFGGTKRAAAVGGIETGERRHPEVKRASSGIDEFNGLFPGPVEIRRETAGREPASEAGSATARPIRDSGRG